MKRIKVLFSLISVVGMLPALVIANQCAQVDCDCSAIQDAKLRSQCSAQEVRVVKECKSNKNVAKSYCGLHGPNAYPVAISLKTNAHKDEFVNEGEKALAKLIKTQSWSLKDSFGAVKAKEATNDFGVAVQLFGLYEKDVDRIFAMQKQMITKLISNDDMGEAEDYAEEFSEERFLSAGEVDAYSQSLWQKYQSSSDEKSKKAYKVLSFKLGRLAANIYEQAGDLLGDAQLNKESAQAWQKAAEVARNLIAYEAATTNNNRHIEFYQAQATARINRATYFWLQTKESEEQVEKNVRIANELSGQEADQVVAEIDSGHEIDAQDMRAIKRPGR